ncbi:MAG TPA: FtsX-like permease family protein, partial [Acidimicrobiales bacterium]|nr:FtsX-like permease family protein [Acidimicrobiales bacterium]
SYLTFSLLIGLVGGLAVASLGAARRTQSSFNVFLAHSNPSDMSVILFGPNLSSDLARLPLVHHVAAVQFYLVGYPAGAHGAPSIKGPFASGDVATIGSLGAEYFRQDKPAVTQGRMANPHKADEFVMTAAAERLTGWHVGQSIPMYFYSITDAGEPGMGTAKVKPTYRINEHLVGTVTLNNEVVLDEVDRYPTLAIFTPALTDPLVAASGNYMEYYLQLDHGASSVTAVEREIIKALPKGTTYNFHVTSAVTQQVNRSIEPEAIALGVFGLIAALVTLVIAGGLLARRLSNDQADYAVLRALGASPRTVGVAGLLGEMGALIAGSILALVVGVLLSPIGPIGPVRSVYPDGGFGFDWTVLGVAFAFFVLALGGVATFLVVRQSRRLVKRRELVAVPVSSRLASVFARAGLALTAVVGVRFALESGRDRDTVPVRSALVGAALAVIIVVATLTFGSSLSTLISRPSLYGWNWNLALTGDQDVPPQSTKLLSSDPLVASWSGYNYANVQIDGLTVPVLITKAHAVVAPPLLSGHEVDADNQIVLGAETMAELHKRVGQTVTGGYGAPQDAPVYVPPTRLVIVGTATLPAVGPELSLHPSMGIGGVIPQGVEPATMKKFLSQPYATLNGPKIVFVRLRRGVSMAAGEASLATIVAAGNKAFGEVPDGAATGDSIEDLGVQYPAEIENYRSIGATPAVLALALAAGAVVALGLTLNASVRRRRRDLAMLRALGFTSRQLRSVVAWQASVNGVAGVLVGVPLGIVLGRWLWTLFARYIDAVPEPTVSILSIVIVALATMVLANGVAALPGRSAARTSTAQVLRGE